MSARPRDIQLLSKTLAAMTRIITTVRKAMATDADALSKIGSEAFSAAYAEFNTPADLSAHIHEHYSPGAIERELGLPDRRYLLALAGDEPAGLCKLCEGPTPNDIPDAAALEIQQLYIHPSHQRRGVGKVLVDAALDEARSAGLMGVWLGVWEKADWAIDFYLNCGFRNVGSHAFQLASSRQMDLLMWMPATDD